MSEDEIIEIEDEGLEDIQEEPISDVESASSESTGSAFGASNEQMSMPQNNKNRQNPIKNAASNMIKNKLGNNDKIPDALKKRNNPSFGNNSNGQNKKQKEEENDNNNKQGSGASVDKSSLEKIKNTGEAVGEQVAEKGGSLALQSVGVPKPIADLASKKLAGPLMKMQKKKTKLMIIGGICSIFLILIVLICWIYITIMPILKGLETIKDIHESVSNFFSSAGHFIAGDGWCATEAECRDNAEDKFYEKVESVDKKYPDADMAVVLSSVLYGMNTEDIFSKGNADYCDEKYSGDSTKLNQCYADAGYEADKETYQDAKGNLTKVAKKSAKGQDEFDKYMIDTFIPNNYEEVINSGKSAERILEDIYSLAHLFNDYENIIYGEQVSSGGVCSYSVNGQDVSNIKVRLRTCSWDPSEATNPIDGQLIDFEKYITGVVYAENSGGPMEALKAQAIAARSFALARAKNMGGSYGISLAQENGQWILDIRNCTADQVYCDPDQGCWSDSSTAGDTVYSGYQEGKAWGKGPLAADSEIRKAVTAVNGMALIDSSGNIVNAPYTSTEQNSWNNKANSGSDYTTILLEQYPSAKTVYSNCSASLSGEWSTWKQGDSRWGHTKMGTSSYELWQVGCLVTSISIQIARSGTAIYLPAGVTEFNPGTFVANNPNMFTKDSAIYNGSDVWKNSMAPGFVGVAKTNDICGTQEQKVAKITEYINQGYYLVTRVKFHDGAGEDAMHWVAVIGTKGNEVQIVDPGWPTEELFSYYNSKGASTNCLTSYMYKRTD